ncbi:phosphoribosyltransferase-like protein, partial [Leptospira wolffii]
MKQFILSEEQFVQNWINNFDEEDHKAIKLLVDKLLLVPESKFLRKMDELLNEERERLRQNEAFAPFVLLPIVKSRKKSVFTIPKNYKQLQANERKEAILSVADEVPSIIQFSNDYRDPGIGSEALLANLITNCYRKWGNDIIINPTINKMRNSRIRNMIFLDDLVGSGDRFIKFYMKIFSHPSLKSWKSSKYLNFTLICYSMTEIAFKRIKAINPEIRIIRYIKCPTLDNINSLTSSQKSIIERTCKKYSKKFPAFALGYEETKALLIFEHSAPNNIPGLLFKRINKKIPALFPNRSIPHELKNNFIDTDSAI